MEKLQFNRTQMVTLLWIVTAELELWYDRDYILDTIQSTIVDWLKGKD